MTLIYYFSGSGNSLAVAKDLADGLTANLVAMASQPGGAGVPEEAEVVGFVFPSHDFQAPAFVQEWMRRVDGIAGKYVFAVMTYGISYGAGLRKFEALVADRGAKLAAGFAVMMPHNGIGSRLQPPEVRERLIQQWRNRSEHVVDMIRRREQTDVDSEFFVRGFLRDRSWGTHDFVETTCPRAGRQAPLAPCATPPG
jgi:flavodoxin